MRKIYQYESFLQWKQCVFALLVNCWSVRDYRRREECGWPTTSAWRTVPSQAIKDFLVLLVQHTQRHPTAFKLNSCQGVKADKRWRGENVSPLEASANFWKYGLSISTKAEVRVDIWLKHPYSRKPFITGSPMLCQNKTRQQENERN